MMISDLNPPLNQPWYIPLKVYLKIKIVVDTSGTTKKPSLRKKGHQFTYPFYSKQKIYVLQFGDANMNFKATNKGTSLWYKIQKRKWYTKIHASVKQDLYDWILQHPQVFQATI